MRIYVGRYTSVFSRDWFSLYFDRGVGIRDVNRATGIKIFIINVIIRSPGIEQKHISIKRPIDQQCDFQFHQVWSIDVRSIHLWSNLLIPNRCRADRERRKKEIIVCKNIYIYAEPVLLFIFVAGRWPLYSDIELDHNRIDPGAICRYIHHYANGRLIERTRIYL